LQALGGRINIEIDEFETPARAYMLAIPTSAKESRKVKYATKTKNGIKT
jgi:hypothetical protein